jgi:hypothetical protein
MMKSQRAAVNVVCGPRGAGKTEFVSENMGDGDFVWDYGEIQRALFPGGDTSNASKVMGEIKTAVFRHLLGATAFDVAWLVVQAPGKEERRTYIDRLNAKIFVIEATASWCTSSWHESAVEERQALRLEVIKWWSKYERVPNQTIIVPD